MTQLFRVIVDVKADVFGRLPWDRAYISDSDEIFKKLWPYSIVMPLTLEVRQSLGISTVLENARSRSSYNIKADFSDGQWWIGSPLRVRGSGHTQNVPYLAHRGHRPPSSNINAELMHQKPKDVRDKMKDPIVRGAFLQKPEGRQVPLCLACPRYIIHTQGGCRFGESICYKHFKVDL